MLLDNFLIEENPPGPADIEISAEVIINRDGKHHAVKIRREYTYRNGKNFGQCMHEFHDLIMQFYKECLQIKQFHIPVSKGQFKDCRGEEIFDELFTLT